MSAAGEATTIAQFGVRAPSRRARQRVERARHGDRDALEELYLEHFDRIFSYLHLNVGNRYDAEDLTMKTFIRMIESIGRFEWRDVPVSAWLFRIAHNALTDWQRTRFRLQLQEEPPEPPAHTQPTADEEALAALSRKSMLGMIERLPRDQKQVLTLKFVFDFSNGEAASILGKTEGAVKSLQHRALTTLRAA